MRATCHHCWCCRRERRSIFITDDNCSPPGANSCRFICENTFITIYVYVYICVYVYTYIYMSIHICINICIYLFITEISCSPHGANSCTFNSEHIFLTIYIYMHIYACMYIHIHVYVHIHTYVFIQKTTAIHLAPTHVDSFVNIFSSRYIHMHIYVCTYAYIRMYCVQRRAASYRAMRHITNTIQIYIHVYLYTYVLCTYVHTCFKINSSQRTTASNQCQLL